MSINGAVRTLLRNNAAVLAAVGTAVYSTRVRSNNLSIANPTIVINTGVTPEDSKDGSAIEHSDIQLDVYADTYDAAADLADDVRTALDRQSGTTDGVNIATIIFQNRDEFFDDIANKDRIIMDFRLRIKT